MVLSLNDSLYIEVGPVLHQLLIFFGAHFSNLIIYSKNKLCKVIEHSFISKYLHPTLTFYIVKYHFYFKNTFLLYKKHKKQALGATTYTL